MIHLCIVESDQGRMKDLTDWIWEYTRIQNCYFDTIKITANDPASKIGKYAPQLQIALINLDTPEGEECGKVLYEINRDCRIMYYRSDPCSLVPLLSSRPISFFLWSKGKEIFLERFNAVCQEVIYSLTFHYETRSRKYLIAKSDIMYFQSDLRYVDIHLVKGENPRILTKLTELEPLTGDLFVRIHKSYLVNTKYIQYLDKKNKQVLLFNGEMLPVSDAQYKNACAKMGMVW